MFLAALIFILMICAAACSEKNAGNTEPNYSGSGETEENAPEILPPVQIKMPEYELTYSGELQDVIRVKEVKKESTLVFTVKLSNTEAEIFALVYNTDDGDLVTVLEDAAGNRIPMAFRINEVPGDLTADDEQLFCSAQETVNEIMESLVLK